jgi:hypothetical protein
MRFHVDRERALGAMQRRLSCSLTTGAPTAAIVPRVTRDHTGVSCNAATSRVLQAGSVCTRPNGPSIASAITSAPGARSGASPPAVPKLTMPAQPRAVASASARSSRSARAANTASTP